VLPIAISLKRNQSRQHVWCLCHVPHAGTQLDQSTISECGGNDKVRLIHGPRLHVDEGQDEGGQGEGGEAQGRRVGNAFLGRGIETRLELTTEGLQRKIGVIGSNVSQRV